MALYEDLKKNFILPNAYEDWRDYRQSVTDYILRETNQFPLPLSFSANMDENALLPTLAILGAGACNDINLSRLTPHFSSITLLDCDENAMRRAIATYELEDCPYVHYKVISLNGFEDYHYAEFCDALQEYVRCNNTNMTYAEFEEYAISLVQPYLQQMNQRPIPLGEQEYDYICCFGVHSQLLSMFSYIYHAFDVNLCQNTFADATGNGATFTKLLTKENERFVPLLHNALFRCAKQAVLLGLETKRTNHTDAIEGAYQALIDLQQRNFVSAQATMFWPFLPEHAITYEMSFFRVNTGMPLLFLF